MAEKLCQLKKKGGSTTLETVLWTNPSPTSTQDKQTITLSGSISDYSSLKFVFYSDTSHTQIVSIMISVDDFKLVGGSTNNIYDYVLSPSVYTAGNIVSRLFRYLSDNTMTIGSCNSVTGGTSNNSKCILYQIIGLK